MGRGDIYDGGIQRQAKRAVREAQPWLIWLARMGYLAKGVVYT
jgi:hypothetical protein